MSDNYKALVAKIQTSPLEGFDNVKLGSCQGYQLVVGIGVESGSLGLLFVPGTQLSQEFAESNDLIAKRDADNRVTNKGYFEENRKVRAIKFRGIKSEGFWIPLTSLSYICSTADIQRLKEGDTFDEINGHKICNKFLTQAELRIRSSKPAGKPKGPAKKIVSFPEHKDTEQLRRTIDSIPEGSIITVTTKLHGTSARISNALVKYFRPQWLNPIFRLLKINNYTTKYEKVIGTRRTVLSSKTKDGGFYGTHSFRYKVAEGLELRKGETLYGEIVGYVSMDKPIMNSHSTKDFKDKSLSKTFGDTIVYKYGEPSGCCTLYAYRMTVANEDGEVEELSWPQVIKRCAQLGIKTVPTIETFVYNGNQEELMKKVDLLVNGPSGMDYMPSVLDHGHIEEGVVLRIDTPTGHTRFLKHKNFVFLGLELGLKEDEESIDLEEVS